MAKLGEVTEGPMTKEQTELQERRLKAFDELREFEDSLNWFDETWIEETFVPDTSTWHTKNS